VRRGICESHTLEQGGVVLWESEQAMRANEDVAGRIRSAASANAGIEFRTAERMELLTSQAISARRDVTTSSADVSDAAPRRVGVPRLLERTTSR
jgi:hypothetical protein